MPEPTQEDVNSYLQMLAGLAADGGMEAVIDFGETQGIIETVTAQQMRDTVGAGGDLALGAGQNVGAMGEPLPHDVYEWGGQGTGPYMGQQIRLKEEEESIIDPPPSGGGGGGGGGGGFDPPVPTGTGGEWPGFDDEPKPFGTDVLPTLTARELKDAEDIITAELRLAGFNSAAIETMLSTWIIPRLTGQFIDPVTGKKMPSPTDPKNLLPELFERPEFKKRFPGYHPRLEAGYNAIDIQDYLEYETTFKELMYTHGLDTYINTSTNTKTMDTYIGDLITGNISIEQVQQRINQGVSAVMNAPEQVRSTFTSWYGENNGENALLANFLDPNEDLFDLKNMAQAAIAGGYAIDILGEEGRITQSMAEEIADLDYSNQQLQQAYTQLSQQTLLFAEKAGEEDYTIAREGVKSALNMDSEIQERIRRRKRQRMGDFSGGGGAMVSGTTTGFGSANR